MKTWLSYRYRFGQQFDGDDIPNCDVPELEEQIVYVAPKKNPVQRTARKMVHGLAKALRLKRKQVVPRAVFTTVGGGGVGGRYPIS